MCNAIPPPLKRRTRFRYMQGKLDEIGLMTNIHHVGKKNFEFLLNGEVKVKYKTRQSCNRQIEKLYKENEKNMEQDRLD